MKSYDDLQRFKEKTHTKHIEFKDMSEQELNSDNTNWTVIKQLLNESTGTIFDNSQRIDAPQPVDHAAFNDSAQNTMADARLTVQSFVAAVPAADDKPGAALLDSISASLNASEIPAPVAKPVPAPAAVSVPAAPLRAMPVARQTAVSGISLLEQMAAAVQAPPVAVSKPTPAPVTPPPAQETARAAEPVSRPAMTDAPVNVSYKQLFSAAEAPASGTLEKDLLLQPLLEKIASCR